MVNHKVKKKLARRMMTKKEIKAKTPPFQSKAWEERKENRARRAKNRNLGEHYRAKNDK